MAFDTKTLEALGLTEEQVKGVMKEHGEDINAVKAQLNDVTAERDGLKTQVSDFTTQLDTAKKEAEKGSESAKQVEELQNQLKESQKAYDENLTKTKLGYEVDSALQQAGALNNKAVKALIDMDKVSFSDDGKIIGLNDQIESVKADNDFLFKNSEPEPEPKKRVQATPSGNPGTGTSGNTLLDTIAKRMQGEK